MSPGKLTRERNQGGVPNLNFICNVLFYLLKISEANTIKIFKFVNSEQWVNRNAILFLGFLFLIFFQKKNYRYWGVGLEAKPKLTVPAEKLAQSATRRNKDMNNMKERLGDMVVNWEVPHIPNSYFGSNSMTRFTHSIFCVS